MALPMKQMGLVIMAVQASLLKTVICMLLQIQEFSGISSMQIMKWLILINLKKL